MKTNKKLWDDIHHVWQNTLGDPAIRIAVLDGRPDLDHPSLNLSEITISYLYDETKADHQMSYHGTAVASLIFGNHAGPIRGVCPNASGIIVPLYNQYEEACSQDRLADAIMLAIEKGADIINISAGELSSVLHSSLKLRQAIEFSRVSNVIVVSAVGNHGCNCSQIPASIPGVLAVGAVKEDGTPFEFSNYGTHYKDGGILVPFTTFTTAGLHNTYNESCSTSVATPIISGLIALYLSWQLKLDLEIDGLAVMQAIIASATPCSENQNQCEKFLEGVLDITGTLHLLKLQKEYNFSRNTDYLEVHDKNEPSEEIMNSEWFETVNHLAIIPDGNRRWSRNNGFKVSEGHSRAFLKVAPLLLEALWKNGLHTVTLWLFSTENWKRPKEEVHHLMNIYDGFLKLILIIAARYSIKIVHLGRKSRLPEFLTERVKAVEDSTRANEKGVFNIALDYGGLNEIERATQNLAFNKILKGKLSDFLDTAGQIFPNPDLIIRTSGEHRMSGFMPVQSRYSEWCFIEKNFPDLCITDIHQAIYSFKHKHRRYGA